MPQLPVRRGPDAEADQLPRPSPLPQLLAGEREGADQASFGSESAREHVEGEGQRDECICVDGERQRDRFVGRERDGESVMFGVGETVRLFC